MASFPSKSPAYTVSAAFVAAIMLGLASFRAASLWRQEQNYSHSSINIPPALPTNKANAKNSDYSHLAKLHIFGEVARQSVRPQQIDKIDAPETHLKLQLIGVIFDRGTKDGFAIISESGKEQKTYHKGDKLPGNATLFAVEQERIILERNGRQETLSLKKPELQSGKPLGGHKQPAIPRQPEDHSPMVRQTTKFM